MDADGISQEHTEETEKGFFTRITRINTNSESEPASGSH